MCSKRSTLALSWIHSGTTKQESKALWQRRTIHRLWLDHIATVASIWRTKRSSRVADFMKETLLIPLTPGESLRTIATGASQVWRQNSMTNERSVSISNWNRIIHSTFNIVCMVLRTISRRGCIRNLRVPGEVRQDSSLVTTSDPRSLLWKWNCQRISQVLSKNKMSWHCSWKAS